MRDAHRSPLQTATKPILPVTAERLFVRRKGRVLLDVPSLTIGGTGTTVLVGPNGAGKSLLLNVMAGLRRPDSGVVLWNGVRPDRQRYCRFGMVLQRPVLLRRSARSNIEYALRSVGYGNAEARERAGHALEAAGLSALMNSSARVLSGGEMQRLALARALATAPDLLFLDEPTSSLDPASTQTIEAMVKDASKGGMRIVLIAHDLAQARRIGDEIIFMHRGKVVEHAPTDRFFGSPATAEANDFISGKILI
ncbi:ATP-binding cassette domain-containing protein [Hoeflea prorocentri]|uniref:ATP-binding cassette domain-containing protein n=1 Tax=Hoeflea prorocentri TaxID=1922333 RepID=A0A9X3ZHV6_9HYPH|nr:ATP-binding cassette domain-containing protein [Hoeflea prorocentri]MCY6382242.1 ATP-binding cassette domain-containing protein [Hoeflea prorocentri]MDA5400042.1 ATP-binding cassette domain-containing protein [Hoeflea prorocentri]